MVLIRFYIVTLSIGIAFSVCNSRLIEVNIVSLRFANTSSNPIRTIVEPLLDCAMDDLRERNNQSLIRYSHTNIFQPNDRTGDCASVADDSQYLISRWYYTRGMSRSTATDIFVWPNCLEAPFVENFATQWDILFVTSSGEGAPTLADRKRGSTWITTHYGCANYPELYGSVFAKYGWRKIFVVIGSSASLQRYRGCALLFIRHMKQIPRIQLYVNEIQNPEVNYDTVLESFNSSSRVLVFFGLNQDLRRLMVRAAVLNLTNGGCVYIAIEPIRDTSVYGYLNWNYSLAEDTMARTAFRSLLILEPQASSAVASQRSIRVVERSRRRMGILKPVLLQEINVQVPMTAYDALFIVDEVIRNSTENGTLLLAKGGRRLVPMFLNRTFDVPSGTVNIDPLGRRILDLVVTRFRSPNMEEREVLFVQPGFSLRLHQTRNFSWYGSETLPPDTPLCGFDGISGICRQVKSSVTLICTSTAVLLLTSITAVWSFFRWRQLEEPGWWHLDLAVFQVAHRRMGTSLGVIQAAGRLSHTRFLPQ